MVLPLHGSVSPPVQSPVMVVLLSSQGPVAIPDRSRPTPVR